MSTFSYRLFLPLHTRVGYRGWPSALHTHHVQRQTSGQIGLTDLISTNSSSTSSRLRSTNSPIREWLVIVPDREGVLQRRIEIRPRHSPNFVRLHDKGYVSWAGPMFANACVRKADVEDRPFIGSVMVVNDIAPEHIYRQLSSDLFIQERIWDWDKVEIFPFRTQYRAPIPSVGALPRASEAIEPYQPKASMFSAMVQVDGKKEAGLESHS